MSLNEQSKASRNNPPAYSPTPAKLTVHQAATVSDGRLACTQRSHYRPCRSHPLSVITILTGRHAITKMPIVISVRGVRKVSLAEVGHSFAPVNCCRSSRYLIGSFGRRPFFVSNRHYASQAQPLNNSTLGQSAILVSPGIFAPYRHGVTSQGY